LVNPVIVFDLVVPPLASTSVQLEPVQYFTVKYVRAEPPLAGADQETVAAPSPATTMGALGASGTVEGIKGSLADEAAPSPNELIACTVKVTAAAFVNPDTVQESSLVEQPAPDDAVTTYPVIVDPPLFAGALHVTVAEPAAGMATTSVGASAGPMGVTGTDSAEALPVPEMFVAVAVKL
jgi:hypothetical protein